jgi:hypothetical protein
MVRGAFEMRRPMRLEMAMEREMGILKSIRTTKETRI